MAGTDMEAGDRPGGYAANLDVALPERSSRLLAVLLILAFIKVVLAIPHIVIVAVYGFVAIIVAWIAQWVVLCTGRYPDGLYDFVLGYLRWWWRVSAWIVGLVDKYPPFTGAVDEDYGAWADCSRPETNNRALAAVRILGLVSLVVLPHAVALAVVGVAVVLLVPLAPWGVVFTGRFSRVMSPLIVGAQRWQHRVNCFSYGLTDAYPPFRMET